MPRITSDSADAVRWLVAPPNPYSVIEIDHSAMANARVAPGTILEPNFKIRGDRIARLCRGSFSCITAKGVILSLMADIDSGFFDIWFPVPITGIKVRRLHLMLGDDREKLDTVDGILEILARENLLFGNKQLELFAGIPDKPRKKAKAEGTRTTRTYVGLADYLDQIEVVPLVTREVTDDDFEELRR